ncbi:MAG TPA: hypothetical protein VHC45_08080 [Gaiellaceae bacterium]|jgi:hypothetical protein|nr:hypothetical protein [Gaiellaceae bacterium]
MGVDIELLERLDRIEKILSVAFAERLAEFGASIRSDKVSAAILDNANDWIGSTELQEKVAAAFSMTTRRVRDRFPDLVGQRVLQVRGAESRPEYRATGLI